jgi:hypothetical protein
MHEKTRELYSLQHREEKQIERITFNSCITHQKGSLSFFYNYAYGILPPHYVLNLAQTSSLRLSSHVYGGSLRMVCP